MVTEKGIASYLFKNSKEPLDAISISKAMRTPIVSVNTDTSIKRCVLPYRIGAVMLGFLSFMVSILSRRERLH